MKIGGNSGSTLGQKGMFLRWATLDIFIGGGEGASRQKRGGLNKGHEVSRK